MFGSKLDLKKMLIELSNFFNRRVSLTADGNTLIIGIPNEKGHIFVCSLEESDFKRNTQDLVDEIIKGYKSADVEHGTEDEQ